MKRNAKTITALSLIGALGACVVLAAIQGAGGLPDEVKSGSLRVPEAMESEAELATLARINRQQAETAATAAQPGQVVKVKLDDEDGYLVWQIDVRHDQGSTEIAVDAGNGEVLAAEAEEADDSAQQRADHDDEDEGGHEDEHEQGGENHG